jgi:hypothetical protein
MDGVVGKFTADKAVCGWCHTSHLDRYYKDEEGNNHPDCAICKFRSTGGSGQWTQEDRNQLNKSESEELQRDATMVAEVELQYDAMRMARARPRRERSKTPAKKKKHVR